jgi:hypothetical protein
MAIRIEDREIEGPPPWIGEWDFPARARFIRSRTYDTFTRELGRYVSGEVTGRSFLIAGHRGAGKTSLVRQAVEDLNYRIIYDAYQAAIGDARSPSIPRTFDLQRPLLVKLHGPSLIEPEKQGAEGTNARPDPLAHVMIALYRALAAEFSRSFANHARDRIYQAQESGRARADVADYLELAGQFTLELDNFPTPAMLRDYYRRIDRIGAGVLWPFAIGKTLQQSSLNERGIREIIALVTASQAFAVCAGEISKELKDKNTKQRKASIETKGEATLKDVVNKLAGIVLGLGVGAMTYSAGVPTAAALAVATGILSTLTLSWTSKRSAKSEKTLDYSLVLKPDKQSLERDLPLVIDRVREAGLAPVFVLDELDKVENAATAVADLIKRLKHLTTDFGCFCFLTDRAYYETIVRKVETEAFPIEHTFFSHLLFILPHPDKLLDFLHDLAQIDPATSVASSENQAARSIFGLFVLHRSKLNMVEVLREIATLCNVDGTLKLSETDLRRLEYVFAAIIQLAIGLIFKADAMRQRVAADPTFMQSAVDALYILSRAWESKEATVKLDRDAIVRCLLKRRGSKDVDPDPAKAERMLLETGMGRIDLDIIDRQVGRLAELLCSSASLKQELVRTGQGDSAALIPATDLIKPTGQPREFEFLYDMYGEEVAASSVLKAAPSTALPPEMAARIQASLAFFDAFQAALRSVGIGIPQLIAFRILPVTLNANELEEASTRLEGAIVGGQYDRLVEDLTRIDTLIAYVDKTGGRLAELLGLSLQVAADARPAPLAPLDIARAVQFVVRYLDLQAFLQQQGPGLANVVGRPVLPEGPTPAGNQQSVKQWETYLEERRVEFLATTPADKNAMAESAWTEWRGRVLRYLVSGLSVVDPMSYADLVCAAANLPPGSLFRRDLSAMNSADWTELCLSGFPLETSSNRAWTFVAGLCALGFGDRLVRAAADLLPQTDTSFVQDLVKVAMRAETAPAHVLIMRNEAQSLALAPLKRPPERVVLALPRNKLETYNAAFAWLREHESLAGVIDEEVEPA